MPPIDRTRASLSIAILVLAGCAGFGEPPGPAARESDRPLAPSTPGPAAPEKTAGLAIASGSGARPDASDSAGLPSAERSGPIIVSAIGDCTLGSDFRSNRAPGSFQLELEERGEDYRYPFSGVVSVLASDDLTIANLEGPLGTNTPRADAPFLFRGKPEYARILVEGSVEVVNLANNHAFDLGPSGFEQTKAALAKEQVGYFGMKHVDVRSVRGIEVVNLGYTGGRAGVRAEIERDVKRHKRPDNLVLVSVHWGVEGSPVPTDDQRKLGRAIVDAGADLVIGTHPHVLQGIEEYRGRRILYSLGNFVFGGNGSPADKDTIVYQELFARQGDRVVPVGSRILPARISTVPTRNDYRPVLLEGAERERVLEKVKRLSEGLRPAAGRG